MLPSVSIVVPAKNEEKVIENCIRSLLNLDYPKDKIEIVLVIDKSEDKTLEICKKFKKRVKIFEPKEPSKCKARAINRVIPYLKGEIIGIYDADCVVDKKCLKEIVKNFSDENVIGVNGALKSYNRDQNSITKALSIETCFISYIEYFFSKIKGNSVFLGKNMFVRMKIFKKIGGFDVTEFSEDNELSLRLKRMGYKIVFDPKAITWSEDPSSLRSFIKQRLRWTRGFIKTLKKKPYNSFRDLLYDFFHRSYFYFSPLGTITLILFLIFYLMNLNLLLLTPFYIILIFNAILLIKSRIFYKEPLRYLIYTPLFFFLSDIQVILLFRAYYDEKLNRELKWVKVERSAYPKRI